MTETEMAQWKATMRRTGSVRTLAVLLSALQDASGLSDEEFSALIDRLVARDVAATAASAPPCQPR